MRELVVENQDVMVIPKNFKCVNKGIVKNVTAGDFTLELSYPPENISVNTFCEFYTQTPHGKLYFDSYPKSIEENTIVVASPAKHRFLQRRQYTRIKFVHDIDFKENNSLITVKSLDISAGGMKICSSSALDIDKDYSLEIPLSKEIKIDAIFKPIRIEKRSETSDYIISGQFVFKNNNDRMCLTQFCTKRSIEIKNK